MLTGRNQREMDVLTRRFSGESAIQLIPYTDQVEVYLAAADVMITKPGGLTSTEAAVMGVPMVHLLAYSACEEKNMEFFASRGMAMKSQDPKEAVQVARALAYDGDLAEKMRKAQRENVNPRAGDEIVERVMAS